ncbi:hypothetical protein COOONC_10612 [Cooperia oncophora]
MERNAERQRRRRDLEAAEERVVRLENNSQLQRRRRQLETTDEREIRLQRNAQIQHRRRTSESIEVREVRSQAEAARLLRRRESESSAARAARLQEDAERHRRRRALENEDERSARLRINASAARSRRNRTTESTGEALRTRFAGTNYLGELSQRCIDCGALHFPCEVKITHPGKFQECCDLGRCSLNFFNDFPEQLRQLFVREPQQNEELRRVPDNLSKPEKKDFEYSH